MNRDNGGGERERLLKQLDQTFREASWAFSETLMVTNYALRLVGQDVSDRVPDSYETVVRVMAGQLRWCDYAQEKITEAIEFRQRHDLDPTALFQCEQDIIELRQGMEDLRANLTRWMLDFEAVPEPVTKAERDAARREEDEAYDTGGASLVRQEKQRERE